MLRKVSIYFLLINFLNTLVFQDVHNVATNDVMVDEINSVYEYVTEVLLDQLDDTPEDEDDDIADPIKISILDDFTIAAAFQCLLSGKPIIEPVLCFYKLSSYSCFLTDHFPPPKFA